MKISAQVVDSTDGQGLPLASVTVSDSDYASLGVGTEADGNGNFSLNSPTLDNNANNVAFSYAGYADVVLHPNQIGATVPLTPSNATLADFTVIAKKIVSKTGGNVWLTVGVGVAALGIGFFVAWKFFKKHKH